MKISKDHGNKEVDSQDKEEKDKKELESEEKLHKFLCHAFSAEEEGEDAGNFIEHCYDPYGEITATEKLEKFVKYIEEEEFIEYCYDPYDQRDQSDMAIALIELGAKTNDSQLEMAVKHHLYELTEALLESGLNAKQADYIKIAIDTPVRQPYIHSTDPLYRTIKILLQHGAEVLYATQYNTAEMELINMIKKEIENDK